ncbi:UNVERIFIED_CONTAM: hypothetical protein HDU68_005531 [Siphonaria sp. JEL0065]|nr:hypothetical protein HDU68_005531 [Siphonaria sp. JEL0065]
MTVECCAKLAKAAGYTLFALEYSEECYGASSYAYTPSPSTKCNMPCKGNADEICGGSAALSVYTFSTFHYSGCFTDWADHPRVLKNLVSESDSMTIETCAELAADQGFSLFGLEFGRECWADSVYQYYPSPTDVCNIPCKDVMMRDTASPDDLDLSTKAFIAIDKDHTLDTGVIHGVQWWWTDCGSGNSQSAAPVEEKPAPVSQNWDQPAPVEQAAAVEQPAPVSQNWNQQALVAVPGYSYTGCLGDSVWSRLLPARLWPDGAVSVDSCQQKAASLGYPIFGVEYGEECWAGWSYAYTPWASTNCVKPCVGNEWQTCGGGNALSIYSASAYNFFGCFGDNVNNRLLSNLLGKGSWMTVESCAKLASEKGFTLFGVEYGDECWADSVYEYYPSSSDKCWMSCSGNGAQTCGGSDALSVYYL